MLIAHLVELKNVCIQELLKQPITVDDPIPDTWLELGHDPTASTVVSTLVVDKNGIPLIAHLPRFLPEHSHVRSLVRNLICG